MAIDAHNLPEEAGLLRQIVLQLLGVVEEKDRLLERVQHQLQQLLRQRYGPKRERIDENQLFLFAAQIIAAARQAKAAEPGAPGKRSFRDHETSPRQRSWTQTAAGIFGASSRGVRLGGSATAMPGLPETDAAHRRGR